MPTSNDFVEVNEPIMVSGEDIQATIDAIAPGLTGRPAIHGIIACLHIAIGLTYPNITADTLRDMVESGMEWIQGYPTSEEALAHAPISGLPN